MASAKNDTRFSDDDASGEATPLLADCEAPAAAAAAIHIPSLTSAWFSGLYRSWQFHLGTYFGVCVNSGMLVAISCFSHRLPPSMALRFGALQAAFAALAILSTLCCWAVGRCCVTRPAVQMPLLFVWNGFLTGLAVNFVDILASCIIWRHELISPAADLFAIIRMTYLVFLLLVIMTDIAISYNLLRFRRGEKTNAMGLTKDQMALTGSFGSITSTWPQANVLLWCLVIF
ncbi:hypothetical protein HDU84_009891 [Entophlyctis sp. JEL0112]|nr:hypothetical protein HDU84_009891 [Entophlyctis sp. JEL0112]